jgi:hypothetical protein
MNLNVAVAQCPVEHDFLSGGGEVDGAWQHGKDLTAAI